MDNRYKALTALLAAALAAPVHAVELGGQIQVQYQQTDPAEGETTDSLELRRLRLDATGQAAPGWLGRIQVDFGGAEDTNEVAVKDAWLQYRGWTTAQATLGNQKLYFSRSFLNSAKRRALVEQPFVGDHNYGVPDRVLGAGIDGRLSDLSWGAGAGAASLDPNASRLDFDTPVNRNSDFNEGWIGTARLSYQPLGKLGYAQGDFGRQPRVAVEVAGYAWRNDEDNNTLTDAAENTTSSSAVDVDLAQGIEIGTALRGFGASVDLQYNRIQAETVDAGFTGGLYEDGETTIEQIAAIGGYMVVPATLELVGGWERQDADNYADAWQRTSLGANYFIHGYDLRLQGTYRSATNVDGVKDDDADEFFLQAQYLF